MTPDRRFARAVRCAIALFVALFVYFLIADLWMPLTPQAQLTRPVVRLAPRVGGQVLEVAARNNAQVQPGDLIFRLDPQPVALTVRQAELALEEARRTNLELDAAIASAEAGLLAARSTADELDSEVRRVKVLVERANVSRQQHDQTLSRAQAARAQVAAAQIASILVLFPMHWNGVRFAGRVRALGTLRGCLMALALQLVLYDHYDILPFVAILLWIAAMHCARIHMLENGMPGQGFGALTTLAIVLGQYLTPTHDMMYSVLYRLSSVCLSVFVTLLVVLVLHSLLDRFPATRHA
ncbi:biotin/lipoyl-binding protein [Pseudomonas kuykendallii]|uniref:HlyD family secretion protein n=1 Tax=Pseudomonas kuykendallii TaxID=1007099 RepID=UPI0028D73212|nr:biotin/lipoyl-binding protein [Pseudomonas kuykendallii]